jgi:hypothetical protein
MSIVHPTSSQRVAAILLVFSGILAYVWFIAHFFVPYAGGSDSSGYLNFARLLSHGELLAPVRSLSGHSVTEFGLHVYEPSVFRIRDDSGFMSPIYPIGAPLHFALATILIGSAHAAALVSALAAIAAGALIYFSCRHLKLGSLWAIGGALVFCSCPLVLYQAIQPMSDVVATTWATATVYAAMRGRDRAQWPLACGAAAAMAVLIRPTNALLTLPILVAVGLNPARLALVGLGALPGVLLLLLLNLKLYGSPLTTSYYSHNVGLFSASVVPHNLVHFFIWIFLLLGPLVICAFALPFFRRPLSPDWLTHVVWAVVLISFYAFFGPAGESWWYLRYILPAFPSLIILAIGGLAGIWAVLEKSNRPYGHVIGAFWRRSLAFAIVVMLSLGCEGIATQRLSFLDLRVVARMWFDVPRWAREHLPTNAMILSQDLSGSLYYYTDLPIVRFDAIREDKRKSFFEAAENQGRSIYAIGWPHEMDALISQTGGNWTQLTQLAPQKITVLAQHLIDEAQKLKLIGAIVRPGTALDFRMSGNAESYLARGWSDPESPGTWTNGPLASLIALSDWPAEDMIFEVAAGPFVVQDRHPSLQVEVVANGTVVDRWLYQGGQDLVVRSARIPASLIAISPIFSIEFRIDQPAVPKLLGVHPSDDRNLGLFVSRILFRRP